MNDRGSYLATKLMDDKFIALSKKNQLTTWSVLNGKIRMEWNLDDNEQVQDFSGYEIFKYNNKHQVYNREWYSRILIKSKKPVENVDESQFYDPAQTKVHMKSQVSYIKRLDKHFYEFKLIEIISDREVKEHFSFVFPFYAGTLQHMFFSSDLEYMYERLENQREFLYKKVPLNEPSNPTRVKWEIVHRFTSFPQDLLENTEHPFILSPDFTQYLDVDRKGKKFMIKDSFTQEVRYAIPEWLMNSKFEGYN